MKSTKLAQWPLHPSRIGKILFYCCAILAAASCLLIQQPTIQLTALASLLVYLAWCRNYSSQYPIQLKYKNGYWYLQYTNGLSYRFLLKPNTRKGSWYLHLKTKEVHLISSDNGTSSASRKPIKHWLLQTSIQRLNHRRKTEITLFIDQMSQSDWHECCVTLYAYPRTPKLFGTKM